MQAEGVKSSDIVQMQADISVREKKIDDQKDIIRIAMEDKRKAQRAEEFLEMSIKEQEDEIANMTLQAEQLGKEAEGARQQAKDFKEAQIKIDEAKIKKMAK